MNAFNVFGAAGYGMRIYITKGIFSIFVEGPPTLESDGLVA